MLYINDELIADKSKDPRTKAKWEAFKREFKDILNPEGTGLIAPFVIKYTPGNIRPNPLPANKGKFIHPASLNIAHVAKIELEEMAGGTVEIRYAGTTPARSPQGVFDWKELPTEVRKSMNAPNIDFAFFFYAYSKDNYKNHRRGRLMVENKAKEAEQVLFAKRNEAYIMKKLWEDEENGGASFASLLKYAKQCPQLRAIATENYDINQLRIVIDNVLKADPKEGAVFIDVTKQKISLKDSMEAAEFIGNALEKEVIRHLPQFFSFYWAKDYKDGEVIYKYDKEGKGSPAEKFGLWAYANKPDLVKEIEDLTEAKVAELA